MVFLKILQAGFTFGKGVIFDVTNFTMWLLVVVCEACLSALPYMSSSFIAEKFGALQNSIMQLGEAMRQKRCSANLVLNLLQVLEHLLKLGLHLQDFTAVTQWGEEGPTDPRSIYSWIETEGATRRSVMDAGEEIAGKVAQMKGLQD